MLNLTPYSLNIIDKESVMFNEEIKKYTSEVPVVIETIQSVGVVSVKFEERESKIDGFSVIQNVVVSQSQLPNGCDICIVSDIYYNTLPIGSRDWKRCVTVSNPVYTPDGSKIIGYLGFNCMKFI